MSGLYMHDHALDHRPWPSTEARADDDEDTLTLLGGRNAGTGHEDARDALLQLLGARAEPEGRSVALPPLAVDLLHRF